MAAYDFEKLRVLVVDENSFMVSITRSLLETMGIRTVLGLTSGVNLIGSLKDWQPDILIVDQYMEPRSGLDLIHEIRNTLTDRQRFLPIILMTSVAKEEVVKKARFWAGADAVLVKPMSARRLFNCIVSLYESDRTFVRTKVYFGPERRVKDRPFEGQNRRKTNGDEFVEPADKAGREEEADFSRLEGDDGNGDMAKPARAPAAAGAAASGARP